MRARSVSSRFRGGVTGVLAALVTAPVVVAATGAPAADAAGASITVSRIFGADRYATAAAIADAGWPSGLPAGATLLLATGQSFPDAVAGAAAAGHLGVPLLLTSSGALPDVTKAEIQRLNPQTVALLGGTSAIGDAVASAVSQLGPAVVRWSGADRYATAAAISQASYPSGATNVYLATGLAFPDALSGAALAAVAGGPLLLTDPNTLPAATAAELTRLHPSAIVVLGGTSAVSDQVAGAAEAAAGTTQLSRISGADRYQTADAVASTLVQVGTGQSTASNGLLVATGLDFPDALAGAAWAGETHRPLLLVPNDYVTPQTWQEIQTLAPPSAVVLGGTSAVSDSVATGIGSGNPPTSPPIPSGTLPTDWPTYHHDGARSGSTTGTPAFSSFASAWKASLDGAVYGQPLVIGSTVVAATEGGSLYGLSLSSGAVLWRAHIADPISRSSLPCGNIDPLGITGTPAYDASTGLVLALGETAGGKHVLAGVRIGSGAIAFSRTLDPLVGDRLATQQRPGLLVANGRVYVAFGGLWGDCGNYIGQVVSVASDGSGTPIGWHVPTSREGGIWGTGGPVLMSDGSILVSVGNGASTSSFDGSDSVTRLSSSSLSRTDYFAPSVWADDNANDLDLGSMTPALVGAKVVIAGKRGTAYLLDATDLGHVGGQLAQSDICRAFGTAAVAGSTAYIPCTDGVRAVAVSGDSMSVAWHASGLPGSPVIASGTVYTTDGSGSVYALDASSGAQRGHIGVGSLPHFASPTLSGKYLLIGTTSGVTAVTVG